MTIEAILNLLWFGIALGALWIWRFRWRVSRRNPRVNFRTEAIAIVCVLALLFPVISLTDDLHPQVIPVDSVSSKRNLCLLGHANTHGGRASSRSHQPRVAAGFNPSPVKIELNFAGLVSSTPFRHAISRYATVPGRSPPSLA